jgi:hypothetical protein
MHETLAAAARLSDVDLLGRLIVLAGRERHASVELVAHLAELDRRKLYRDQGHGSLFSYCTDVLRLSEHATFNRIEAARACRSFPAVLDLLACGAVSLSTVRLLAPHLTRENHERLLAEVSGRSKRQVEVIVARLAPRPDVPASVRKLPARVPEFALAVEPLVTAAPPDQENLSPLAATVVPEAAAPAFGSGRIDAPPPAALEVPEARYLVPTVPRPRQRPMVAPLTPERYRVQFTVSRETREKLCRVQDLLRREIPDGDPGVIFERALTLLLEDVARKKLALTARQRPRRGSARGSRHISAEVKRTVWLRDHGQCAFVAASGKRCRERTFLEFHHVAPFAVGGEATVTNISLRCREHNVHEAERVFGAGAGGRSVAPLTRQDSP